MSIVIQGWIQDPESTLDYTFDWSKWLDTAEEIITHDVSITPNDHISNLVLDKTTVTTTSVTPWLSGGRKNTTYRVTCMITTTKGRTDSRSIRIGVKNR